MAGLLRRSRRLDRAGAAQRDRPGRRGLRLSEGRDPFRAGDAWHIGSRSKAMTATVIARLVGAMMVEQNDEWSLNRRHVQLEGLQTVSDTVPTRLSAEAR